MNKKLCSSVLIIFSLSGFQAVNASVIDENGPNPMVVAKAFGFMLFGNDGFMTPGIENLAVDGCKVSYETDGGLYSHAIQRIYICLLYTSPSPRDLSTSRMPSSA